jgi:hypothetical protein
MIKSQLMFEALKKQNGKSNDPMADLCGLPLIER